MIPARLRCRCFVLGSVTLGQEVHALDLSPSRRGLTAEGGQKQVAKNVDIEVTASSGYASLFAAFLLAAFAASRLRIDSLDSRWIRCAE